MLHTKIIAARAAITRKLRSKTGPRISLPEITNVSDTAHKVEARDQRIPPVGLTHMLGCVTVKWPQNKLDTIYGKKSSEATNLIVLQSI